MRKVAVMIIIFFMTITIWSQEVINYKEQRGNKESYYTVTITKTDDTYIFQTTRNQGTQEQQALTDLTYATYNFTFTDSNQGSDYTAVREGDKIRVTGTIKNKDVSNTLNISAEPWYQFLEEPLGNFALSSERSMKFWTLEPLQAIPAEIETTKIGTEEITINDKKIQVQRVRITLTGFYSAFWHADYLYDASDGSFLRVETTTGPGGERVIIEQVP